VREQRPPELVVAGRMETRDGETHRAEPLVDSRRSCCGATRVVGGEDAEPLVGEEAPDAAGQEHVGRGERSLDREHASEFAGAERPSPTSSRCKFTATSLCFFPRMPAAPHGEGSRGRLKDDDAAAGRAVGRGASPPCSCPGPVRRMLGGLRQVWSMRGGGLAARGGAAPSQLQACRCWAAPGTRPRGGGRLRLRARRC
jgi:hypothetical protein